MRWNVYSTQSNAGIQILVSFPCEPAIQFFFLQDDRCQFFHHFITAHGLFKLLWSSLLVNSLHSILYSVKLTIKLKDDWTERSYCFYTNKC